MSKRGRQVDFAEAIQRNDLTSIKSWLSSGKVDANAIIFEKTLLDFAAELGRKSVVELLLNAGARIDDVNSRGQSACHVAASMGDTGTMRVLLAHRPSLALKNKDGKSALQVAICSGNRESGMFSFNENDDVAMLLIRAGASLDELNRDELCRFAAINTAAIQLLMNRNIFIGDLRDKMGQTPLHFAAHFGTIGSVLNKLLECGVDLEARTKGYARESCIGISLSRNRPDALRLLLLAGADVDGEDEQHLLHMAATQNRFNCSMLLLAAGADVTLRDRRGQTAFLLAAQEHTWPIVSFVHAILAAGADLDAADTTGKTPRQLLADRRLIIDAEQVETARRQFAKVRLDFVRNRAMEVCIGLQSLRLDALQVCEILQHACGPLARLIAFHQWWKIATTVKHFKK
jgi:ankyrin repeat protein